MITRERVASPDAQCDGCKKKWTAQMRQGGYVFHLCVKCACGLIAVRGNKEGKPKNAAEARAVIPANDYAAKEFLGK